MKGVKAVLAIATLLAGVGWAQTPRPAPTNGGTGGGGGGSGTVTSVGALSPLFTTATATTTPAFSLISQSQNLFFASPNGSSGVAAFRAMLAADMPNAGVFTGDATTTFPALTIGNAAITAVKMVNAGVFTGDVTTTFPAITVAKVNGIAYSATAAAHSVEIITSANTTATAKVIPDCTDTAGNHINYTQSTDAFSCGTSASVAGTVTTVGFTGGLISVANPTTAPALTVAGTSGGVPYFSGAATWASSGAGVQNAMMTWGGAGNAPTSPLSLLVTNQNANNETWTWYNSTATTGKTALAYRTGASSAANDVMVGVYKNDGTTLVGGMVSVFTDGRFSLGARRLCISDPLTAANFATCTGGFLSIDNSIMQGTNAFAFNWSSTGATGGSSDIGLDRDAAGIFGVTNGTQGTTAANYRAIKASAHYIAGTTFTASGCSNGTLTGGASAGTFTLGANSCNVVVTMGNSATAPNGWSCRANDQTANTILIPQGASSTTTATFEIPAGAGASDVINFACLGY